MPEQYDLWGKNIQPKQTRQSQEPEQKSVQPVEMSANDMVAKPVTSNSSANHIATRLNYAFEQSNIAYKRLVDMKKHQEWADERHNELKQAVNTMEQRMSSFIEAYQQDMLILRTAITSLTAEIVIEDKHIRHYNTAESHLYDPGIATEDGSEFDDKEIELSSPETEARIHGEID
jgi:hypothetical protein